MSKVSGTKRVKIPTHGVFDTYKNLPYTLTELFGDEGDNSYWPGHLVDIDFNIVWGKLEEINTHIVGNMVINIKEQEQEPVLDFLKGHDIVWEIL